MNALTQVLPQTLEEARAEIVAKDAFIATLQQQIAILKKHLFGRSSEKLHQVDERPGDQASMFAHEATEAEAAEEQTEQVSYTRKKKGGGRNPIPADLPRVDVVHDVPEADKTCACGCAKHKMGEDVTEKIEIIPARIFVERHVRPKYVCKHCSGSIVQAPAIAGPIPRGIAGPGFLAYMILSKYGDHIPLCRMERILGRSGIDITRSNMSEWAMRVHNLCKPLIDLMKENILHSQVINSDDTPIRVQKPGGGETKRCNLWVYLGDHHAPYSVYDFREGRGRAGPTEILKDYKGFVQADAYSGYHEVFALRDEAGRPRLVEAGCMAHARRYFFEAAEAKDERARVALDLIGRLYGIERELKEKQAAEPASIDDFHATRKKVRGELSAPIMSELKSWMEQRIDVLPKSPLGDALKYAQNQWTALNQYIANGFLEIDNNAAERALRPVAVGRKNWLFVGSQQGGHAAATFFTLIESAKRSGLNPFDYLHDLFTRIGDHSRLRLAEFLPDKWKAVTS